MSLGAAYDREVREFLDRNVGNPVIEAHFHSANHLDELRRSDIAGCFDCMATFAPAEITTWIDDGTTAMCPYCEIDSVIGDASGYPVADQAFLEAMNKQWFS